MWDLGEYDARKTEGERMLDTENEIDNDTDVMTGEQLKAWREARHISAVGLADLLGVSRFTIFELERGKRRGTGKKATVSKMMRLALAALAGGVLDYDGTSPKGPPGFVTMEPSDMLADVILPGNPFAEDGDIEGPQITTAGRKRRAAGGKQ